MKVTASVQKVLEELKAGNDRFLCGESTKCLHSSLKKLKEFSETGQFPKAIILCCSDSRAPVEMIFDQDIGDLFVIRVAGNIVAPSLVGSVEFAVSTFGTELVIVMGHSQCGAIRSTLSHIEDPQAISSENIHDIVSRIKPHIFPIAQRTDISYEEKFNQSVAANIMASVGQLSSSSRLIEEMVKQDKLTILGAKLNISTGEVAFLNY